MATDYRLFPDRREEEADLMKATVAVRDMNERMAPDEVLPHLRRIDWAHPCLLVYRSDGEDRWSQVLLGLNKPELGEDDE